MQPQPAPHPLDPAQQRARAALDELALPANKSFWDKWRTPRPAVKGVYLYGPVGRGKTHVMDTFFAELPAHIKRRRVHFHAFMLEVHEFLHQMRSGNGEKGVDNALPRFAAHVSGQARLLCFDEFHVVDIADAMILGRLFTCLFEAGVTIITTSNWAPDDLYKGGLKRENFLPTIELIKANMRIVNVDNGVDYRLSRLAGHPVYFHPLGTAADREINAIFADLTAGGYPAPETIDVMGHSVPIAAAACGVARATFADLCERNFAAQDYLALAARYQTLILEHVPKLTYDRRNETKRFMILVDIWYEHRLRLIISADAPLDRLYIDGQHAFEFQRTLSRLQEMGSQGYLTTAR